MQKIDCPAIRVAATEGETAYPVWNALTPWNRAAPEDVVALAMSFDPDGSSFCRPRAISFLLRGEEAGNIQLTALDALSQKARARVTPAALKAIFDDTRISAIMTGLEASGRLSATCVLVAPGAMLLVPEEHDDYDLWIRSMTGEKPQQHDDIAHVAQLVVAPAPSHHAALSAAADIAMLLAWHDRLIAVVLDGQYRFTLDASKGSALLAMRP